MDKGFLENLGLTQETVETILAQHQLAVDKLRFDAMLERTVTDAGSRSVKAAVAMLDKAALQSAEDPAAAAKAAVAELKKENAWLFKSAQASPYAAGTGTGAFTAPEPQSLAEALRQRFRK